MRTRATLRAASALLSLTASVALAAPVPQGPAGGNPFQPFDKAAYVAHLKILGATPEQVARFDQETATLGVGRAADRLVRSVRPDLDAAVKLSEDGDPRAALELAKVLASTGDKLLQGHVRYHLARVFLDGDDPERAVEVLHAYVQENANLTPLDDEVVYFYAQALAEVPMAEEALNLFKAFLQWFPNASERYRATAHQRAQELEGQMDSALHQLADGMKKVGRDLRRQETGKPTQERQDRFVEKLQELIELYEEQENQGGDPSGNGQSSNPASRSALPQGEARVGSLEKRAKVAARWGDMKDKEREKIESEVKDILPPESRKMLEEYYKKLGTGGNE
ncbi:MAG: hypothetical protein Fur0037_04190 [Planctomycetota bacterium]